MMGDLPIAEAVHTAKIFTVCKPLIYKEIGRGERI